ncbi:MAG: hypothetical protein R2778_00605 [Saprospiraceae bacterium]
MRKEILTSFGGQKRGGLLCLVKLPSLGHSYPVCSNFRPFLFPQAGKLLTFADNFIFMSTALSSFQASIQAGIPASLPPKATYDTSVSHAPVRVINGVLSQEKCWPFKMPCATSRLNGMLLAPEFADELNKYDAYIYVPARFYIPCIPAQLPIIRRNHRHK